MCLVPKARPHPPCISIPGHYRRKTHCFLSKPNPIKAHSFPSRHSDTTSLFHHSPITLEGADLMLMHLAMPNDFLVGSSRRMSLAPIINMESSAPRVLTSEKWNAHDDQTLMTARAQGLNWAPIQLRHFPTKTPNACRKRHERLMEKRSAEDWSPEQLESLGREYAAVRKEMWSMLAARLGGEKWQIVEKKVRNLGLHAERAPLTDTVHGKGLEKSPSSRKSSFQEGSSSW